jgi:hypothetical protein
MSESKSFTFTHLFFEGDVEHLETDLPSWLHSKDFKWFLDKHVLTLEVGSFVETDFHRITRTK